MKMTEGFSLEHFEVVRFYLLGDVKFLHLLLVLMVLDVITGIFKAIKNHNFMEPKKSVWICTENVSTSSEFLGQCD